MDVPDLGNPETMIISFGLSDFLKSFDKLKDINFGNPSFPKWIIARF